MRSVLTQPARNRRPCGSCRSWAPACGRGAAGRCSYCRPRPGPSYFRAPSGFKSEPHSVGISAADSVLGPIMEQRMRSDVKRSMMEEPFFGNISFSRFSERAEELQTRSSRSCSFSTKACVEMFLQCRCIDASRCTNGNDPRPWWTAIPLVQQSHICPPADHL